MARKNESPQKAAMQDMMRNYIKNNDITIKNGTLVKMLYFATMDITKKWTEQSYD